MGHMGDPDPRGDIEFQPSQYLGCMSIAHFIIWNLNTINEKKSVSQNFYIPIKSVQHVALHFSIYGQNCDKS